MHFLRFVSPIVACACLTFVAGCGGGPEQAKAPYPTFEVVGKVIYRDASHEVEALDRAKVWFQSKAKPDLRALGAVGDDGSFFMTVLDKDQTWAGVPEGEYRVCIQPPLDDETRTPLRHVIHAKYQDFDSSGLSVTVPLKGDLTFVVEPPPRGS